MGNQHEIVQVEPRRCNGVALRVVPGHGRTVRELLESAGGEFYTGFVAVGEPLEFPNLLGPPTSLGVLDGDHVTVQSGGKMWCGYDAFVDHVRKLSPYLEDALFYVADEEDFIDEFRFRAGELQYRRVHQGGWWPLDDFLQSTERPL